MSGAAKRLDVLLGAIAVVALLLASPSTASAGRCGGKKLCVCGDKVFHDYTLPADLGPCAKEGLRIAAPVTLDGGGHVIRGGGPSTKGAGLRIGEEGSGAQVRNLTVTGFEHGVRLVGARNVHLTDVEAHHNGDPGPREGYGIDVSQAASDNVLERVKVHDNADEGIHFGANAARNRVTGAQVYDNSRENVYFLSCSDNRLENSKLHRSGTGNASIYVKFATGTVIQGNTVDGGSIQIRGGARDTQLIDNTLSGTVILEEQDDRRFGPGKPSGTVVRGGRITASDACVRVEAATGTRVEGVTMTCPEGIRVGKGSRVAVRAPEGVAEAKVPVRCAGGDDCAERLGGAPAH
jgi:putative cofactor-binding repeat protein